MNRNSPGREAVSTATSTSSSKTTTTISQASSTGTSTTVSTQHSVGHYYRYGYIQRPTFRKSVQRFPVVIDGVRCMQFQIDIERTLDMRVTLPEGLQQLFIESFELVFSRRTREIAISFFSYREVFAMRRLRKRVTRRNIFLNIRRNGSTFKQSQQVLPQYSDMANIPWYESLKA